MGYKPGAIMTKLTITSGGVSEQVQIFEPDQTLFSPPPNDKEKKAVWPHETRWQTLF